MLGPTGRSGGIRFGCAQRSNNVTLTVTQSVRQLFGSQYSGLYTKHIQLNMYVKGCKRCAWNASSLRQAVQAAACRHVHKRTTAMHRAYSDTTHHLTGLRCAAYHCTYCGLRCAFVIAKFSEARLANYHASDDYRMY